MIDKRKVGSRISMLRKRMNLSQTGFAEILGISPQAVSKWETGAALPDVEILLAISRHAKESINEILAGKFDLADIASRPYVLEDIAYFVPKEELPRNVQWANDMVEGQWVSKNWQTCQAQPNLFRNIAQKICRHGGLIVEIGTGPGGGYMPALLREDPAAHLIVSDLSPTVVREWRKLLETEICPPNLHYAALDNCELPFHDNSIDVISAGGGFGNTEGDKFKALTEIYRVLKPGGLYVSGDGFVTQETLRSLPASAQEVLLAKRPDIFEDYYEASVTAGFKTIDNVLGSSWSTRNDESEIASLAKSLGVDLTFTGYLRYCTK